MISDIPNILIEKCIEKFNLIYPDININDIDQGLLENILINIANDESEKINKPHDFSNYDNKEKKNENTIIKNITSNQIIKQNILMADEIIPEMSIPANLIYLKGKLNGTPLKIMVDTGAESCVIFNSVIEKCGIEYLVDKSTQVMVQGAHGLKPTIGTLWYLEIDLDIGDKNYVTIPITTEVIDDSETIQANKIINEHLKKFNGLLTKKDSHVDSRIDSHINSRIDSHGFEIILGMTFLKSYKANIDFKKMTITLNDNIKIKFN